ncbi:hypothetical protein [Streptomyces noursei]|uniref:hypothetical protein n=1 Tax=Streptomyces noursei TaxID=1971 RepID=UPI0022A764C5|nr:hypothetical protein [Streptomyces noursei]MCZ1016100.1 hypothetical protein [Streptomyces noursei]
MRASCANSATRSVSRPARIRYHRIRSSTGSARNNRGSVRDRKSRAQSKNAVRTSGAAPGNPATRSSNPPVNCARS